jgi:hypothetical protein
MVLLTDNFLSNCDFFPTKLSSYEVKYWIHFLALASGIEMAEKKTMSKDALEKDIF